MALNSSTNELAKSGLDDSGQLLPMETHGVSTDELHRASLALTHDDRLRLIVQLWKSLPAEHRSALLTLQMEDAARRENYPLPGSKVALKKASGPTLLDKLFDPSHTSDLYTAPRRFDLATIFVATAAYSLVLGGLTALGWPPVVKVIVSLLAAAIAVAQALFKTRANPRGVSIVTGVAVCTLFTWIGFAAGAHRELPISLPAATVFLGLMGGSIAGYLIGTCVGGVFLVADMARGKFERRDLSDGGDSSPSDKTETGERIWHE